MENLRLQPFWSMRNTIEMKSNWGSGFDPQKQRYPQPTNILEHAENNPNEI